MRRIGAWTMVVVAMVAVGNMAASAKVLFSDTFTNDTSAVDYGYHTFHTSFASLGFAGTNWFLDVSNDHLRNGGRGGSAAFGYLIKSFTPVTLDQVGESVTLEYAYINVQTPPAASNAMWATLFNLGYEVTTDNYSGPSATNLLNKTGYGFYQEHNENTTYFRAVTNRTDSNYGGAYNVGSGDTTAYNAGVMPIVYELTLELVSGGLRMSGVVDGVAMTEQTISGVEDLTIDAFVLHAPYYHNLSDPETEWADSRLYSAELSVVEIDETVFSDSFIGISDPVEKGYYVWHTVGGTNWVVADPLGLDDDALQNGYTVVAATAKDGVLVKSFTPTTIDAVGESITLNYTYDNGQPTGYASPETMTAVLYNLGSPVTNHLFNTNPRPTFPSRNGYGFKQDHDTDQTYYWQVASGTASALGSAATTFLNIGRNRLEYKLTLELVEGGLNVMGEITELATGTTVVMATQTVAGVEDLTVDAFTLHAPWEWASGKEWRCSRLYSVGLSVVAEQDHTDFAIVNDLMTREDSGYYSYQENATGTNWWTDIGPGLLRNGHMPAGTAANSTVIKSFTPTTIDAAGESIKLKYTYSNGQGEGYGSPGAMTACLYNLSSPFTDHYFGGGNSPLYEKDGYGFKQDHDTDQTYYWQVASGTASALGSAATTFKNNLGNIVEYELTLQLVSGGLNVMGKVSHGGSTVTMPTKLVSGVTTLTVDAFTLHAPWEWASGKEWRDSKLYDVQVSVTDSNGVPLGWYALYEIPPEEAEGDGDADGVLNWEEYVADTVPTDAASYLKIKELGETTITFDSSSKCVYALNRKSGLTAFSWGSLTNNVLGTGSEISIPYTKSESKQFYQLEAVRP